MSKYTTQLRWIVEQEESQYNSAATNGQYHQSTYKKLGLDTYPIFDSNYRNALNDKIINHFYFREIGFETVGQFTWYLRQTMLEIMPFYNQYYKSLSLVTDPMHTVSKQYTENWNSDSSNKVDSTSSSDNRNIYQDTPMGMLEDNPSAIENLQYATNVTYDNGSSNGSSSNTGTSQGDRTRSEKGFDGSQSELLKKYRETFVNVDVMIIKELETLFMGLW